jgi:hypothetical protein
MPVIVAEKRPEQVRLVELELEAGALLRVRGHGGEVAAGPQAAALEACATGWPALRVGPGLAAPLLAAAAFVLVAFLSRRRSATSREAGQKLMLYGLLLLIV